jgi:hypothetical protein
MLWHQSGCRCCGAACSSCLDVDNAADMSAAAVAAGSTAAGTARSFREEMSSVAESLRAMMLYAAAQYSSRVSQKVTSIQLQSITVCHKLGEVSRSTGRKSTFIMQPEAGHTERQTCNVLSHIANRPPVPVPLLGCLPGVTFSLWFNWGSAIVLADHTRFSWANSTAGSLRHCLPGVTCCSLAYKRSQKHERQHQCRRKLLRHVVITKPSLGRRDVARKRIEHKLTCSCSSRSMAVAARTWSVGVASKLSKWNARNTFAELCTRICQAACCNCDKSLFSSRAADDA